MQAGCSRPRYGVPAAMNWRYSPRIVPIGRQRSMALGAIEVVLASQATARCVADRIGLRQKYVVNVWTTAAAARS